MSNQYTPGPWLWINDNYLDGANGATVLEVGDDGRDWGLHSCLIRHNSDEQVAAANKRLIAAAPDLLEALRKAVLALAHVSQRNRMYHDDYMAVNAALQKALGES